MTAMERGFESSGDTNIHDIRRNAMRAALTARAETPSLERRPVAFRARDYGDGWILFHDEAAVQEYVEQTDAQYQGLYVRGGK